MLIKEEFADLDTPTGPMRTHLFRPLTEGKFPGLVFYSEIFQVSGPIRRFAARLAGQGYLVAVPEVYHEFEPAGTVLAYDDAGSARGNLLKVTKEVAAYDSDAAASLTFLQAHPQCSGNLGAVGVCLGGHLAFRAAMNPSVCAGVCFYPTDIHQGSLGRGRADNTLSRMGEISGEMLMMWGRQDPHIPAEGRRKIYDEMSAANLPFEWHEWNGAHAFMRDEGHRYDPAIAQICFAMMFEFLERRLK